MFDSGTKCLCVTLMIQSIQLIVTSADTILLSTLLYTIPEYWAAVLSLYWIPTLVTIIHVIASHRYSILLCLLIKSTSGTTYQGELS